MHRKLFFLACLLISVHCLGQQYPFVHYTPKDGLVNSRVRKAYQDSKGRMYFITYGGLSVYDGVRFRNYTMQDGLPISLVNDVLEIGDDSLLVATNACGLNMLVSGQIKKIELTGPYCPVVNNFLKSKEGDLYCSTDDGLYKLVQNQFEKLRILVPGSADPIIYLGTLSEYKQYLIFSINDLRRNKGLFLFDKQKKAIVDAMPQQEIFNLKADQEGVLWVSTNTGINNLDSNRLAAGKLLLREPYASYLPKSLLEPGALVFNQSNEPMIAHFGKAIRHYRKNGSSREIILPEQSGVVVQSFIVDREDILWVCHDGNGIYKLPTTTLQAASSYQSTDWSAIITVASNSPDTIWTLTNNRRMILHTPGRQKIFTINPGEPFDKIFYTKKKMYAARGQKLFVAPLPAVQETSIRFHNIYTLPDTIGFGGRFVNDPYGNLVLFNSRAICVFQNDKLIFTYPLEIYDLVEGLFINRQELWVVSRKNGLQVFSIHPGDHAQYLQMKKHYLQEFGTTSPRCATVDKKGMLWTGTRYDGLLGFEYNNNGLIKKYHIRAENGLTDNFVVSLATDADNNILIGTQTGLDRMIINPDGSYRIDNITKSNNIFSFISSIWTDAANNAYALTNAGTVLQVEPARNKTIKHEPSVIMEEIRINGKRHNDLKTPLRLNHDQRNITFSLAAPSFINEKQIKYSYLLSGSGNTTWSDTTTLADITLLNLSPGNYTLHVKAFFPSAGYPPKDFKYEFSILPPWWQTWWFRVAIGMAAAGLLFASLRFYYRRKLERQRTSLEKLQAVEKERTRIATDMHDDLGAGLSRIKFLSETIGIKQQQQQAIDEDITRIREYSHEMIGKMGEIVWALNEKNDSLSDLLSYTRSYAVEYLSQNGISCEVSLPDHLPEQYVNGEFRRNIYLSVKEALHNIVKHAQARHVRIKMETEKGISILIHDDGIGFSGSDKPYSNGLRNMAQRMKDINGSFEIMNTNGTTVKMKAPISV